MEKYWQLESSAVCAWRNIGICCCFFFFGNFCYACTHNEVLANVFLKIHACTHGEVLASVTFRNFCYACSYRKVLGIGLLFSKFLVCVHVHIDKFWHLLIWEILLCINAQIEHLLCWKITLCMHSYMKKYRHLLYGKFRFTCKHAWRNE